MIRREDVRHAHPEAWSWILAAERAATAKAGAPLEGLAAEAAEGLGILLMFLGRRRARLRPEVNAGVAGAVMLELVKPLALAAGLTPEEALRVRPMEIA